MSRISKNNKKEKSQEFIVSLSQTEKEFVSKAVILSVQTHSKGLEKKITNTILENLNTSGQIRVGRRIYKNGVKDPIFKGFKPIVCLTKSTPYGDLGPYVLKDKENRIMENIWQFSKVYKKVPYSKQRYSRWDSRIIWEHPSETHVDSEGKPNDKYWFWRKKGMNAKEPIRYPVGKKYAKTCLYSLSEDLHERLDYIEARKKIYVPLYSSLVQKQPKFKKLKKKLENGENLLIIEVDGPHQESLEYYQKEYGVSKDFIEESTMLATKENLNIMLNDPKHPFGHGYCLAAALLNISLN